jgi:beta-lactamase class A
LFLAGGLLSFVFTKQQFRNLIAEKPIHQSVSRSITCDVTSTRLGGFEYIRPLLYVDKSCESPDLISIKQEIEKTIALYDKNGLITNASVFLRDFDHSNWISIQDDVEYHPGSLFKIPMLFAWLHLVDKDPGLLNKSFLFEGVKDADLPVQNYVPGKSLEKGTRYTVKQLLALLIIHSDNQAQWLLTQNLPQGAKEQVFIDLGIGVPIASEEDNRIRITARQFSTFMKALVNSSYLSQENSEFALSLLAQTEFKAGFVKGLPEGTKVAHKFGEWDDQKQFELHESGIIYVKNRPFLLTIMSKGTERKALPGLLSAITRTVYEQIGKVIK